MKIELDPLTGALRLLAPAVGDSPPPREARQRSKSRRSRARATGNGNRNTKTDGSGDYLTGEKIRCPLCNEINTKGRIEIPIIHFSMDVCVLCIGAWERVSRIVDFIKIHFFLG